MKLKIFILLIQGCNLIYYFPNDVQILQAAIYHSFGGLIDRWAACSDAPRLNGRGHIFFTAK